MTTSELAQRLDSCSQYGSRELDDEIARLFADPDYRGPEICDGSDDTKFTVYHCRFYTTVMTDTMRLCKGQWEVKFVHIGQGQFMGYARCTRGDNLTVWFDAWGATPQLALAVAAVKAEEAGR